MKKVYIASLFLLLSLASCAVRDVDYLIKKPTNVTLKNGKWMIDQPLLERVDPIFEGEAVSYYNEYLTGRFDNIKYISEFNKMATLNKTLERNAKTLEIYKQQTDADYLISTKIEMLPLEDPLLKVLLVKIQAYDLNTMTVIFQKDYYSVRKVSWSENTIDSKTFKKFVSNALERAIKNVPKKSNWKAVEKSSG